MEDYKSLEKEMSGKGPMDTFPKGKAKIDADADVKKKDAAAYKDTENKADQG